MDTDDHHRTLKVSSGHKLYYYSSYQKYKSSGKPPLVFIHGWPNNSGDYAQFVQYFEERQHPCIAVDQLGFGKSDKPEQPELYTSKESAKAIIEILDFEGVENAVFIGHDWGSPPIARIWIMHPGRVLGLVFVSVPYDPPGPAPTDYEAVNDMTERMDGYAQFGYWDVFMNSPELIGEHADAFFDIFYAKDPMLWKKHFAGRGQLREWLLSEGRCERADYADAEWKARFVQNDWMATTHYYRMLYNGTAWELEKDLPTERFPVTVPSLTIAPDNDACAQLPVVQASMQYFSNGKLMVVNGGHNYHFEEKDRFCSLVEDYLTVFQTAKL